MDKGSLLAYVGAIVTIVGALSVIGIYLYAKGKPYAVNYLKKLLKANEDNADNCIKNAQRQSEMQDDMARLRTDFQKEVLGLHKENNKQSVFNGRILTEIRELKEDIRDNANRISKLELEKERELLHQEKKELLHYKGE